LTVTPEGGASPVTTTFVGLESPGAGRAGAGGHPCQGLWHAPGARVAKAAFVATHYEVDFAEHYLAGPLAERGFGFLGWNTRYRGNGAYFNLGSAVADIGVGVRWIRRVAGVDTVVLLGNSGGASLMGAYQSHALGQPAPPTGRSPTGDLAAADLEAADLFVSLNAHRGRPDVLTSWLDPSVTDESDPLSVDPALDMFAATNGPPYEEEFLARYRGAQEERNHRITDWAEAELDRLGAAGAYDRVFNVHRTWADPRFLDLAIDPSDRRVGCYFGDPRAANYGPFGLASTCTLRSWLSMWSLRRSSCRAEPHLARITQPALVVQSTQDQGCYPSDARAIHAALGSADKTLQTVAGDHYLASPAGARAAMADLIAGWVEDRV